MRQGQTRYPFLVLQFPRDEDYELDLNLTDEVIKDQYDGKLQKNYNGATYEVVSAVFRGLTQKKITGPGTFKR